MSLILSSVDPFLRYTLDQKKCPQFKSRHIFPMVVIVFPFEFQGNEKLPKLGGIIQKVKYIEGSANGAVCVCTFHFAPIPVFFL